MHCEYVCYLRNKSIYLSNLKSGFRQIDYRTVVVVVVFNECTGLSPIWPSPPERRVNTGDTPFQSTSYTAPRGGSNQRSLDYHGSATIEQYLQTKHKYRKIPNV
ncbi:hypothetical protein DPMN_025762 [Dreissena polymorpha]|uniref:Uncharacterized protein n=1 Tax=Dreissena polymorpha TaxID=45954 RepID=A0A9D4LS40_DREPO|nr:hypothetical protein DPMN_025762 [Dreissena polymorpha]